MFSVQVNGQWHAVRAFEREWADWRRLCRTGFWWGMCGIDEPGSSRWSRRSRSATRMRA